MRGRDLAGYWAPNLARRGYYKTIAEKETTFSPAVIQVSPSLTVESGLASDS
jgi:hypothetical protein